MTPEKWPILIVGKNVFFSFMSFISRRAVTVSQHGGRDSPRVSRDKSERSQERVSFWRFKTFSLFVKYWRRWSLQAFNHNKTVTCDKGLQVF